MHSVFFSPKDENVPSPSFTLEVIQEEIVKIQKAFLSSSGGSIPAILNQDTKFKSTMEEFAATKTEDTVSKACRAIGKLQDSVFMDLQEYFEDFLDSDSYFKLASEIQSAKRSELYPEVRPGTSVSPVDASAPSRLSGQLPKSNSSSIIIGQLLAGLERESSRLTGSKPSKKGESAWDAADQGPFTSVDDVLDVDLISNLENDPFTNDFQKRDTADPSVEDPAPGELLRSSTKLQQVKEDLDRVLLELDCLNLLHAQTQPPPHMIQTPIQLMQAHILEQSQELIRQDISELMRQKIKYESQEQKEAIVPGACTVKIRRTYDTESVREQKRVTFYEVLIQKELGMRKWTVKRRYSDFDALHRRLKEKFPFVADFELPGKTLRIFHSKSGKEELKYERMMALEKYLQVSLGCSVSHLERLIDNPMVCQSDELRTFLSTSEYKSRHYRTVQSIIANEETLTTTASNTLKSGAHKLAKLVETAGFRFTNKKKSSREDRLRAKMKAMTPDYSSSASSPEKVSNLTKSQELLKSDGALNSDVENDLSSDEDWGASSDEQLSGKEDENVGSVGILADPLCDLLIKLFDLKEQDIYLKQNASAMLLKQVLGGRLSLERYVNFHAFICK